MRVTIIGPGAVGVFIGQSLIQSQVRVQYIGRQGPVSLNEVFLTREGPITLKTEKPSLKDCSDSDLFFVTVKAFDLEYALSWTRNVRKGTPVIVTVNGAVHDILARENILSPETHLRVGACTVGVSRSAQGAYELRSKTGNIQFGSISQDSYPTPAEQDLSKISPKLFVWRSDMAAIYRRKWLYNTVINTLTAAKCLSRNGALLNEMPLVSDLFEETYRLGEELWGSWAFSKEELFHTLIQLIRDTEDNENSMARDVRLGRPTESQFLAGLATNRGAYPLLNALHLQIEPRNKTKK